MVRSLATISEKARTDSTSGASEILISVLMDLRDYVGGADKLDREELSMFAFSLHQGKPAMAPLFNLSNSILCLIEDCPFEKIPSDALDAMFAKAQREEESANPAIAELSKKRIDASRIVTMSYSSTVIGALRAMGERRDLIVTVAESLPGGEGRRTAKILSSEGMATELIPDSLVFSRVKDAAAAIVGADAVTSQGVVNKVGTYALALAAVNHEIRAYVLCSTSKFCRMKIDNLGFVERRPGKNLSRSSQVFESSPIDHFHRFVTDRGILRPTEVRSKLKDYRIALAWYY